MNANESTLVPLGIPYSQLPASKPGDAFFDEWNTYCREAGRLLAEGHEGKHVLIKGKEIVGLFETWDAARKAGLKAFLLEPFFVHCIRTLEPYLRIRGSNYPCPN